PQIAYAPMDQQSSEYSPPEVGLVVLVFQKGDDPIDAINHMMSFLTSVVASQYPATNNQLRTSSNPHQQATINNGLVTIQPIQGRQNFVSAGSSRPFTSGQGGAQGKQRVITCYNCKGECHMSKQCIKLRRKRDAEWLKDKVLLVQAQAKGLQEDELEFLTDPSTPKQVQSTSEQFSTLTHSNTEINLTLHALQDDLILSVIEQIKTQVVTCTKINQDNKQRDNVSSSESAPTFAELFETNELKAQTQEKDTMILNLKEKIKSSSADDKERKEESKVEDIET
nr:hypothetical protein [Tanacetum cinerariifolium]